MYCISVQHKNSGLKWTNWLWVWGLVEYRWPDFRLRQSKYTLEDTVQVYDVSVIGKKKIDDGTSVVSSRTERLVLISGFWGRQSMVDDSHKSGSGLPLVCSRHVVTFPTLEPHRPWPVSVSTACITEACIAPGLLRDGRTLGLNWLPSSLIWPYLCWKGMLNPN